MSYVLPGVNYPREIPVAEGVPPGWKAIEQAYGETSTAAGKTYIRYHSLDGKHRSITSPQAVIKLDAELNGYDSEVAVLEYKERLKRKKEQEASERTVEREAAGIMKGERRDKAIERFRSAFGPLDGPTVHAIPGWKTRWDYSVNCNQTHVVYTEPSGKEWRLLKDLEACMGAKMENGEDLSDLMKAALDHRDQETFAEGSKLARTHGTWLHEAPERGEQIQLTKQKVVERISKNSKRDELVEGSYDECVAKGSVVSLSDVKAGTPAASISSILLKRRFSDRAQLLTLSFGSQSESNGLSCLNGFYYELDSNYNERPLYQKVSEMGSESGVLVCTGLYIFWSDKRNRWELGSLDQSRHCLAFTGVHVGSTPVSGGQDQWRVLRAFLPASV